ALAPWAGSPLRQTHPWRRNPHPLLTHPSPPREDKVMAAWELGPSPLLLYLLAITLHLQLAPGCPQLCLTPVRLHRALLDNTLPPPLSPAPSLLGQTLCSCSLISMGLTQQPV